MVRRSLWRNTRKSVVAAITAVVVAALLVSCGSCAISERNTPKVLWPYVPPALPDGVVVMAHSSYYKEMWEQVEHCAGKTYPFRHVTVYMVPTGTEGFTYRNFALRFIGYARQDRNFVLIGGPWTHDDFVVRHEFLHIIASPEGHNPVYYGLWNRTMLDSNHYQDSLVAKGKCTELVACGFYCRMH